MELGGIGEGGGTEEGGDAGVGVGGEGRRGECFGGGGE